MKKLKATKRFIEQHLKDQLPISISSDLELRKLNDLDLRPIMIVSVDKLETDDYSIDDYPKPISKCIIPPSYKL